MLMEGVVSVMALIAATSLAPGDYFAINLSPAAFQKLGMNTVNLSQMGAAVGEVLQGRAGGAVSLAVGMAQIFSSMPGMRHLLAYWYHFAIMFEALFILTTIDAGTRIARYILQEILAHAYHPFGETGWWPGVILTSFMVSAAWGWMLLTGNVSTIWPMFGVANQLLATIALAIGTTFIIDWSGPRYALITFVPFLFMLPTTVAAAIINITDIYLPRHDTQGYINAGLTIFILALVIIITFISVKEWLRLVKALRESKVTPRPRNLVI